MSLGATKKPLTRITSLAWLRHSGRETGGEWAGSTLRNPRTGRKCNVSVLSGSALRDRGKSRAAEAWNVSRVAS